MWLVKRKYMEHSFSAMLLREGRMEQNHDLDVKTKE